jgi:hypothetical protein
MMCSRVGNWNQLIPKFREWGLTSSPTEIKSFKALASTSPTSTPPSLLVSIHLVRRQRDLLGKEDPITFTGRVDTDIVFGIGGMRAEWLNDESVEGTSSRLDLLGFTSFTLDPSSSLFPFLV